MRRILIIFCLLAAFQLSAQELDLMFYNTENLFDTIDANGTSDEEFTPNGKKAYSKERYDQKIDHLARVINEGVNDRCPSILGLCEIENAGVVDDFRSHLKCQENLKMVHYESPDQRGIDNAFLYDHTQLELLDSGHEPISLGAEQRPTRDIVWGLLKERSTEQEFIVLVNHWPSRYGGVEESAWKRMKAAKTLSALVSKLGVNHANAKLIVMGDLNDYCDNESVALLESCDEPSDLCMVNLMEHLAATGKGTHAYKGEWGILDHILVSNDLANSTKGWSVDEEDGRTISFDWMMYESSKDGKKYPSRTYGDNTHYGGYSDHLPVLATLRYLR